MWNVEIHADFEAEYDALALPVRRELDALIIVLEHNGPSTARPHVDTLGGSRYANLKELRFNAGGGVWRVLFAFDPKRDAVLLVAGDKAGVSERRFYKRLIAKAEARYAAHLESMKDKR